jgi:hypothetical protein
MIAARYVRPFDKYRSQVFSLPFSALREGVPVLFGLYSKPMLFASPYLTSVPSSPEVSFGSEGYHGSVRDSCFLRQSKRGLEGVEVGVGAVRRMLGYDRCMQPDPSAEFIKKIESDIQQSGFPLELDILNICSTRDTGRRPSVRYEFRNALRELDLHAFFSDEDFTPKGRAVPQRTSTSLIIECKKSSAKPWVFFSSPSYAFEDVRTFLKYTSDFDKYLPKRQRSALLYLIRENLTKSHYADPLIPRCFSYQEAFRGPSAHPSEIYSAVDSVITYLEFLKELKTYGGSRRGFVTEIYLPIVVLDGYLFEASISKAEVKVQARQHLQLRTFLQGDIYIIDIVTRNHFEKLFNDIADFHKQLVAAVRSLKFAPAIVKTLRTRLKKHIKIVRKPRVRRKNSKSS